MTQFNRYIINAYASIGSVLLNEIGVYEYHTLLLILLSFNCFSFLFFSYFNIFWAANSKILNFTYSLKAYYMTSILDI